MSQMTLSLVESRPKAKLIVAKGFVVHLPDQSDLHFRSVPDLLVGLNRHKNPDSAVKAFMSSLGSIEISADNGCLYKPVAYGGYIGIEMRPEDGPAQDIVDQMFADVYDYARKPDGSLREVWEMTADQWDAISIIGSVGYGCYPLLSTEHRKQRCTTHEGNDCRVEDYIHTEFHRKFGYGHNGPVLPSGTTNSRHDVHVGYALAQDKPIPDEVIQEYTDPQKWPRYDQAWFGPCIQKPFMRGRMHPERLRMLINATKDKGWVPGEITVENFPAFVALLNQLAADASYVAVDDLLYRAGVLAVVPMPTYPEADIGKPHNVFSEHLRKCLIARDEERDRKHIVDERGAGRITLREIAWKEQLIARLPQVTSYIYANKIAVALEAKDLDTLIETLDRAEDTNVTTKRAVETFYKVKLRNVKAAERRRTVFALCGFDTQQSYLDAEKDYKERSENAKAQRENRYQSNTLEERLASARRVAALRSFSISGTTMDGAKFIDSARAQGFTSLQTRMRGAVATYVLANPATSSHYRLRVADGTVDYARILQEYEEAQKESASAADPVDAEVARLFTSPTVEK